MAFFALMYAANKWGFPFGYHHTNTNGIDVETLIFGIITAEPLSSLSRQGIIQRFIGQHLPILREDKEELRKEIIDFVHFNRVRSGGVSYNSIWVHIINLKDSITLDKSTIDEEIIAIL